MSRRGELDAIVVGAGAIGGAIALALARDGFEIALVEARAPKPWRAGDDVDLRVVALAPDARGLLDDLDVWAAMEGSRIGPYRHMRVWDALAPGELAFDAADHGEAALGWIVENRLVQHALWQGCTSAIVPDRESQKAAVLGRTFHKSTPRVHCPAEVAELDNGTDAVSATLTDGTRLRAKLLIAAEGAESSVRAELGIAFAGRDYHQRAVVAHVATERAHGDTAWQRFRPGGPLAFLPLADGRCSIVWSLPDAEAARILALDDAAFRAELGCAFTVSPGWSDEVVERSLELGMPTLPGVATGTEIQNATATGLSWVKGFPASVLGSEWFRAMTGPFPDVSFVATGGISAANARDFLAAGVSAVALGSSFRSVSAEELAAIR